MEVVHLGVENVGVDGILVDETNKKPRDGNGNATSEGCQATRATETLGQSSSENHFQNDNPKTAQTEVKKAKCSVEVKAGPYISCTSNKNVTAARVKRPKRTVKVQAEIWKYNQGVEESDEEETEF